MCMPMHFVICLLNEYWYDTTEKNGKQLESVESDRWVERWKNYEGKDLWKRWVLSLEWKWEGVMDGYSVDEGNGERTQ